MQLESTPLVAAACGSPNRSTVTSVAANARFFRCQCGTVNRLPQPQQATQNQGTAVPMQLESAPPVLAACGSPNCSTVTSVLASVAANVGYFECQCGTVNRLPQPQRASGSLRTAPPQPPPPFECADVYSPLGGLVRTAHSRYRVLVQRGASMERRREFKTKVAAALSRLQPLPMCVRLLEAHFAQLSCTHTPRQPQQRGRGIRTWR